MNNHRMARKERPSPAALGQPSSHQVGTVEIVPQATVRRRGLGKISFRALAWFIAATVAAGCGAASQSGAESTAFPAATIELHRAPDDLACDSVGMEYRSMTFRFDPAASEQVVAITNLGTTLLTYWSGGFVGGTAEERVVYDPAGEIVVTDGEVLVNPERDWPRLNGYFVCPTPTALYILLRVPS